MEHDSTTETLARNLLLDAVPLAFSRVRTGARYRVFEPTGMINGRVHVSQFLKVGIAGPFVGYNV